MQIELQLNSILFDSQEMEIYYPYIMSALKEYLPDQKSMKKRIPKKYNKTISSMIDGIIESIRDE